MPFSLTEALFGHRHVQEVRNGRLQWVRYRDGRPLEIRHEDRHTPQRTPLITIERRPQRQAHSDQPHLVRPVGQDPYNNLPSTRATAPRPHPPPEPQYAQHSARRDAHEDPISRPRRPSMRDPDRDLPMLPPAAYQGTVSPEPSYFQRSPRPYAYEALPRRRQEREQRFYAGYPDETYHRRLVAGHHDPPLSRASTPVEPSGRSECDPEYYAADTDRRRNAHPPTRAPSLPSALNTLVNHCRALANYPDSNIALSILRNLAHDILPIVQRFRLRVSELRELDPAAPRDGRNEGRGRVIWIKVRHANGRRWRSGKELVCLMLHELAHCEYEGHGWDWSDFRDRLEREFLILNGLDDVR